MSSRSPAEDYDINQHDHSNYGKPDEAGNGKEGGRHFNNKVLSFHETLFKVIDGPVTWFREKIVEPNQTKYPWYHEKLRRVPTIDKCFVDDQLCFYEADMQYKRDREVDSEILSILRYRMDDCVREEYPDFEKCFPLKAAYEEAATAWFTKYGDLGVYHNVKTAYMKQKHRLLWERRHGRVGCGMKSKDNEVSASAEDH